MRSTLLALAALSIGVNGCDKGDDKAAPAASSAPSASATVAPAASTTPAASASAPVPPPKCPSGLTGNAVPAFCIKLPSSYAVKDVRTSPTKGSIAYDTGTSTDNLMISYDTTSIADQIKDVEGELKFGGVQDREEGRPALGRQVST